jgi:hypothetical protein
LNLGILRFIAANVFFQVSVGIFVYFCVNPNSDKARKVVGRFPSLMQDDVALKFLSILGVPRSSREALSRRTRNRRRKRTAGRVSVAHKPNVPKRQNSEVNPESNSGECVCGVHVEERHFCDEPCFPLADDLEFDFITRPVIRQWYSGL